MTTDHRYQAYRLQLASDRPLPALVPGAADCAPDLTLHWREAHAALPTDGLAWQPQSSSLLAQRKLIQMQRAAAPDGEHVWLRLGMSGERQDAAMDLVLSPCAREAWIRCLPEMTRADAESALINVGLGCALRLRGVLCLHGSTVVVNHRAIVILGPKHSGKSTLAAALIQQGARLLADDLAALTPQGTVTLVEPGFPSLRLWPPSLEALHGEYAHLPRVFTDRAKRYLPMRAGTAAELAPQGSFCPQAMPLAAIYLLGHRAAATTSPAITPLSPQERVPMLAANTFAGYMVMGAGRAREFVALSRLAQTIPIRHLQRPNDLARMPELSRLVLEDASRLP
jgi:hypothetical protein